MWSTAQQLILYYFPVPVFVIITDDFFVNARSMINEYDLDNTSSHSLDI